MTSDTKSLSSAPTALSLACLSSQPPLQMVQKSVSPLGLPWHQGTRFLSSFPPLLTLVLTCCLSPFIEMNSMKQGFCLFCSSLYGCLEHCLLHRRKTWRCRGSHELAKCGKWLYSQHLCSSGLEEEPALGHWPQLWWVLTESPGCQGGWNESPKPDSLSWRSLPEWEIFELRITNL